MTELLEFLETNALIMWMRGSPSILAYPTVLASHTIGMAFLVGTTTGIALRTLGFAPSLPLAPLNKFFPVAWVGCWLATLSGAMLLAGEATRFLTMPAFYIKLTAIVLALVSVRLLRSVVFTGAAEAGDENGSARVPLQGRILAGATLTFWAVAVLAGRAMAYWSVTGWKTAGAFLVLALVLFAAGHTAVRLWNRPERVGDVRTAIGHSAK